MSAVLLLTRVKLPEASVVRTLPEVPERVIVPAWLRLPVPMVRPPMVSVVLLEVLPVRASSPWL